MLAREDRLLTVPEGRGAVPSERRHGSPVAPHEAIEGPTARGSEDGYRVLESDLPAFIEGCGEPDGGSVSVYCLYDAADALTS